MLDSIIQYVLPGQKTLPLLWNTQQRVQIKTIYGLHHSIIEIFIVHYTLAKVNPVHSQMIDSSQLYQ